MAPQIPFSEPPWLAGFPSPYYNESHKKWQKACRAFLEEHLLPYAMDWEREETVPDHLFQTFAKHNMLIPNLTSPLPVEWLRRLGINDILGTPIEEWDYLHTGIYLDEMSRSGLGGPGGSMTAGHAFGIPPIIKFGNKALHEKFLPDVLTGKKRICIAITEPGAGSDVANIATTAKKTADGKHYIINGQKKWITNGIWSDYATMAVRTGGPGGKGLSMIVCPLKNYPGVDMRRLKVAGQISAGTTFIDLDDVKVPVENLIGEEGKGMNYVMTNFNHERLTICCSVARQSRVAVSAALEYVMKREAFGKPLIEQPVVRHRLAKVGAELETYQAWVEQFLYSMTKLTKEEADLKLGGLTALAKAKGGMVFNECAQTAVLLFGGNGYTRTGQGEIAERLYREVPGTRIPGGSEDVMLDLAIRQLVKNFRNATKELSAPSGSSKL
ncbi:Acyl-CoA dehydrogenase apdG [Exophiala mesophila]|uniref:Acyl-CoA dehydrogenase apdG n=1 Tax=Exophiala mesophila TaxID=212818 RepID=A0A438MVW2_EXOME|nr:Acyl-CoA dehydrogenase apdG [Exophiala mesophila]